MIYIEDDFPLENGFDVIIPISVSLRDGEMRIEAYECVKDIAEEYSRKFKNDPLSQDALTWLDAALRPFCDGRGYAPDDENGIIYEYLSDGSSPPDRRCVLQSTFKLDADADYRSSLECDIDLGDDPFGEYPFEFIGFGTVIDGELVSVCSENPQFADGGETEVGVETHHDHRGQGYAASNLAACCDFLIKRGQKVFFKCAESNAASRATAEKVGMTLYAKSYHYACYLTEE